MSKKKDLFIEAIEQEMVKQAFIPKFVSNVARTILPKFDKKGIGPAIKSTLNQNNIRDALGKAAVRTAVDTARDKAVDKVQDMSQKRSTPISTAGQAG